MKKLRLDHLAQQDIHHPDVVDVHNGARHQMLKAAASVNDDRGDAEQAGLEGRGPGALQHRASAAQHRERFGRIDHNAGNPRIADRAIELGAQRLARERDCKLERGIAIAQDTRHRQHRLAVGFQFLRPASRHQGYHRAVWIKTNRAHRAHRIVAHPHHVAQRMSDPARVRAC